jgi:Protein of unknown function (DUF2800)
MAMEQGLPDTSSEHADEGTAAHFLASECLTAQCAAGTHLLRVIAVSSTHAYWADEGVFIHGSRTWYVDAEMAAHVQAYIDAVLGYAHGGELWVEQRVDFSRHVGVPDQFGTSDAVVLQDDGTELQVHDLKYGRGVKVDAEENEQLMLYALGALDLAEALGYQPTQIRLVIHQPRLDHVSAWVTTTADLLAFAKRAKAAVQHAEGCITLGVDEVEDLKPGEKQCRWCKAKATCGALAEKVQNVVGAEFKVLTMFERGHTEASMQKHEAKSPAELAWAMSAVDLVEMWCKAIRAETERRLLAGQEVEGWKLVEGRRGARKWADEKQAEEVLKAMRVKHDQMYDYSVISPTSAEKLAKAEVIGPRQWPKLQALITQGDGKPSVAPASDKRPALVLTPAAAPTAEDFEALT